MTWLEHHIQSERFASDAEVANHRGEQALALELYASAARAEEQALLEIDMSKPRAYGIIAVSAVALHYKAAMSTEASTLAHRLLGSTAPLPNFARRQLDDLLETIRREKAGISFADAHLLVSIRGGEIVQGGAPLDLILSKAQKMKNLLYRTTEHLKQLPHRTRGEPSNEVQDSYKPWIFQTAPGSYQFAVSVQQSSQLNMFDTDDIHPKQIVDGLFDILLACAESPVYDLPEVVPDAHYRNTFLKLTRDLAPTAAGKGFSRIDVRSANVERPVSLSANTRNVLNGAIRTDRPTVPEGKEEEIRGILRALHLDQDWIEVRDANGEPQRVNQVKDEVDDRLGAMVNHPVTVLVWRIGDDLHFRDIEADE